MDENKINNHSYHTARPRSGGFFRIWGEKENPHFLKVARLPGAAPQQIVEKIIKK